MKTANRNHKKGFTLVELIVVIAIIGVLAAIVVPTTLHFVEQGRIEAANEELGRIADALNYNVTESIANGVYNSENKIGLAALKAELAKSNITGASDDNRTVKVAITIDEEKNDATVTLTMEGVDGVEPKSLKFTSHGTKFEEIATATNLFAS